ncbi:MAG: XRE family transcriptional regulator [Caulobacteraceae bacterium]|nr:XRE family transcriptional regulator [Caulobacteraceae bacterium]
MPKAPDQVDAFVGARIAQRRAALGLSQQGLADRLGISPQQIQKYEAGTNRVSVSRLHRIATVLAASTAGFFPPPAPGRMSAAPPESDIADDEWLTGVRFLTASVEGRAVATGFGLIESREARRAIATLVDALAAR